MSEIHLDAVTSFLHAKGISTEASYLGRTEFLIGRSLRLSDLELVYRFEEEILLICDFCSKIPDAPPSSIGNVVQRFFSLIKSIERSVPAVKAVSGIIRLDTPDSGLLSIRNRLIEIYEKMGANCIYQRDLSGVFVKVQYKTEAE
jgi:hypothetical protein